MEWERWILTQREFTFYEIFSPGSSSSLLISSPTFYEESEHEQTISFSFSELRYSPLLEFNSSKIRQYLTNWGRWNKSKEVWSRANQFTFYVSFPLPSSRGTQSQFSENICLEDDLRSTIFGTFVENFLACLPLLGFSNI